MTDPETYRRYNESAKGRSRTKRYRLSIKGFLTRREHDLGVQRERVVQQLADLEGETNARSEAE